MFHRCNTYGIATDAHIRSLRQKIDSIEARFDSLRIPSESRRTQTEQRCSPIDLLDRIENLEQAFVKRLEQRVSRTSYDTEFVEAAICGN